ncbi:MAG: glycosyltransferase [Desulfurococcales archaeon]|nr:glycosyltransferase [Desulfurococcales archaeon]
MSKPMNITVVVMSYQAWKHPRAIKIARTLARSGYKVKMWGTRKPFQKGPRIMRGLLNYIFAMIETLTVKGDIYWVENVPDIIYITLPLLHRKYVYDRRSPWAKQLTVEIGLPYKVGRILELVERYLIAKSIAVAVASTPMKYEFKYDASKPLVVIPNYPEKSFYKPNVKPMRETLGIPGTTKIFGFIGKLSKMEGVDLLKDVPRALEGTDSELWIIGDGPLSGLVKRMAEKYSNVRWFGWIDRRELPKYLASLNYGLVPRHRNPFHIFYNHEGIHKIGEYLAYKIPVITCGIADSPYYYNTDPALFTDVISKIARDEIRLERPIAGLYWEQIASRVTGLTRSLLE